MEKTRQKNSSNTKTLLSLQKIVQTQLMVSQANFNLDAFMKLVVKKIQQLTAGTGAVIELVEGDEMVYRAATGTVANHIGLHIARATSISGLCVKLRTVLISHDTEKDKRVNVEACRQVKARSLVVAPLFHEGKTIGVLKVLSKIPHSFDETSIRTLQVMAGVIGSALSHQIFYDSREKLLAERTDALKKLTKAQKALKQLAHYDSLTHLPNRSLFNNILNISIARIKRTKKLSALMYLDIDHFKNINDTLGHHIGDKLLAEFAKRLKNSLRLSDVPARLGGDEFVILLENLKTHKDAVGVANKIIANMQKKFILEKKPLQITTSIGIRLFQGEEITAAELTKQADHALYAAKKAGRNTFKIFNS